MKDLDDFTIEEINNKIKKTSEQSEIEGLCYYIFKKSRKGKRFLELLNEYVNNGIIADPNLSPNMAYFREGERNIVRKIYALISVYESNFNTNTQEACNDRELD